MEYTKEEMLKSIEPKDGYVGGEAWEAARKNTREYDWEHEWDAFDPKEAMDDAFIHGIEWALSHLKQIEGKPIFKVGERVSVSNDEYDCETFIVKAYYWSNDTYELEQVRPAGNTITVPAIEVSGIDFAFAKNSLWLCEELHGSTLEDAIDVLNGYGEVSLDPEEESDEITDEDGDGNVFFVVKLDDIDMTMHIHLVFEDGVVDDVNDDLPDEGIVSSAMV